MIKNDEQLARAQEAVLKLQKFLQKARQVHTAQEYRALSEPILMEIQQREQEIIEYLSRSQAEMVAE